MGPISSWIHKSESFRFSFVILSPQCLIEACAEGRDIYEKGGIPHAVGLLDDDVLLKEKRKKIKILPRRRLVPILCVVVSSHPFNESFILNQ